MSRSSQARAIAAARDEGRARGAVVGVTMMRVIHHVVGHLIRGKRCGYSDLDEDRERSLFLHLLRMSYLSPSWSSYNYRILAGWEHQ